MDIIDEGTYDWHDDPQESKPIENSPATKRNKEELPSLTKNREEKGNFWKTFIIIISLVIISISLYSLFLVKEGKLSPEVNNSVQTNNEYSFNPSISNPVNPIINNNFTQKYNIELKLTDDAIKRICNSS